MNLRLSCLLFILVTSLPAGRCSIGNKGISFETCTAIEGLCFFGCKLGWVWIAYCNNIMSCCRKDTDFVLPQTKGI
ncbi:beta-defensin 42 precursor [Mus musculus]|uniref:Beta-defensin 42 n=2 Tax=Mus TaxID=862507 RepID=DFB42_MOUSE|nr:beta-defensin 42 precursor [Mus musculus]NP_001399509.1 beta-defensin 42 precursor [Mus musculus]Q8BVB5.1 RecName: Full=Beta-defensin 42; Short=BD-42; Short=mBD-42; AltName: Full=Defensin, beta 42; Flags: Precursor [Mus musculus]AAI46023.1 Defensin beta 42 [Mus musculus]AAI46025.1 Defensin beta 42 [Mus musculus]AAY59782.1 beta-defensin 44 [Mus musculus]EDL36074.1 mCG57235, isoform CRA_a [Mus musculus]EDL36075.1 mCG57235, isoform CRA_a [Mus musculus]|eukprot:NP_001030082.1 beta-defensin 42 precursor [Mus musculus]